MQNTRSVCPVCLRPVPAVLRERDNITYLEKTCPEHGSFSVPVWHGRIDRDRWQQGAEPLKEEEGLHCPERCGICREHRKGTCCALLEVTARCDLNCRFCFARGGEAAEPDPSTDALKLAIACILELGHLPTLQLSGGEPTLRDDLPELIRYARSLGCPYVQLNTNGLRLAREPDYALRLKEAGLSYVFLQFDGTDDGIYRTLRGRELYALKKDCILNCARARLGVTLVPTVVRGVNDKALGDIVRFGLGHAPTVRGVHFQPVSYFGRVPAHAPERYTLDELIADVSGQTGIALKHFMPSRCDHPLCGFHMSGMVMPDGTLLPLSSEAGNECESSAAQNRDYIGARWTIGEGAVDEAALLSENGSFDLDAFARRAEEYSFTLSAMAFQDAGDLDIARLRRCSLHVYKDRRLMPFCAAYLSPLKSDALTGKICEAEPLPEQHK